MEQDEVTAHSVSPPRRTARADTAKFYAVVRKNALLKGRGLICVCSALELLVPLVFVALLCLPRALIDDDVYSARFYAPSPITDLAWSQQAPGDGSYRIVYSPGGSADATAVAQMAAKELVCSEPSFMRQVALASNYYVDIESIREDGMLYECWQQPLSCVRYISRRPNGIGLHAQLLTIDLAEFCTDACLRDPACFGPVLGDFLVGVDTAEQAAEYAIARVNENRVAAIVSLPEDLVDAAGNITYTIRVNASDTPTADIWGKEWAKRKFIPWVAGPDDRWKSYWTFANVQKAFDQAITSFAVGDRDVASVRTAVYVKQYPYPPFSRNLGSTFAGIFFGMALVFAFLTTVIMILKSVVMEKELRIREGMMIMGLRNGTYWLAWFVTHYSTLLVVSVAVAAIGSYAFKYSDAGVMFVFFALWTCSLVMWSYAVSTLFWRSKIATIGGSLVYALCWLPGVGSATANPFGSGSWTVVSLLPPSGIYMWGMATAILENLQVGVRWGSLFDELLPEGTSGTFSAGAVMLVTAANIFIYATLAYYLDQVMPSQYGQTRSPLFFLQRSYWAGAPTATGEDAPAQDGVAEQTLLEDGAEAVPPEKAANLSIDIRGLRKVFNAGSSDPVTAVNGLSLQMFEGEVTALLGHNGAGKTTTISLLSGLIVPSAGRATVNGRDILTEMSAIRRDFGLCPQHDILWPTLTVTEHMEIYAAFKEVPPDRSAAEIERLLAAVGLLEKRRALVHTLSGGQRRKLSLAIAFVGDPKVVVLDEPTSGMDPYSRRFSWEMIRSHAPGRTIVLTTHFMDEADLLGDRIAIMARGKLACVGSSVFLKSRFGLGYHLTFSKLNERSAGDTATAVEDVLERHVAGAQLESDVGHELTFMLPASQATSFPSLLADLDERKDALGVSGYGISCTRLEEIFLSIAEHGSAATISPHEIARTLSQCRTATPPPPPTIADSPVQESAPHVERRTGVALMRQQFGALMWKRWINTKRDKLAFFTMYVIPATFVVLGLVVVRLSPGLSDAPPALMDRSFLADKPTALAASPSVAQDDESARLFLERYPQAELVGTGRLEQWNCSGSQSPDGTGGLFGAAAAAGYCEPEVQACPGCTQLEDVPRTLDGWLIERIAPHESCKEAGPESTCSALYVSELDNARRTFNMTVAVSSLALHALPAALAAADSAVHGMLTGGSLSVINWPMPPTELEEQDNRLIADVTVAIFVVLALGTLSASFSVFLVWERASNSKHLQMVGGVNRWLFWGSALTWDLANFLLPVALLVAVFAAFNEASFRGESLLVIFVLLLAFGLSAIPLAYALHWPFSNEMNCLAAQMGIYLVFGVAEVLAAAVLEGLNEIEGARKAWDVLQWAFRWLPHYNVGKAVYNVAQNNALSERFRKSPWDLDVSGYELLFLLITALVYALVTLAVEFSWVTRACHAACSLARRVAAGPWAAPMRSARLERPPEGEEEEDVDVGTERVRVDDGAAGDMLVVRGLRKVYPDGKVAVHNLSFGVPAGSCFGLLGINGAGKTTTFKVLTGELEPTSGGATVRAAGSSLEVVGDIDSVRQHLGYCPQFDGLQYNMTGYEHLRFYAAIRGIPDAAAECGARELIALMRLGPYADRHAGTYSGGNKRKLSVAVALVGDPAVVLLDEPSTGMDPEARRFLWGVLSKQLEAADRCIVLTSHSMDECEALCTTLGIMAAGRFRCLGTVQHLKNRHGEGYHLSLRAAPERSDRVKAFVAESLPAAVLSEEHHELLKYSLPPPGQEGAPTLGAVFEAAERAKQEGVVDDYSLEQGSLEQIFVRFAQQSEAGSSGVAVASPRARQAEEVAIEMQSLREPATLDAVRCPNPSCGAVLEWSQGASVMRCGACGELVEASPPGSD